MNKTVTVNIGGSVFHIEEHAYEQLKQYLDALRRQLSGSEGRDEILQDIESRLAEMFNEKLQHARQVITQAQVSEAMEIMGRPEQVAGTDINEEPGATTGSTSSSYKRLYRDADDKVIGGVCSGISHYIGIDPVWLRLAFAAAFFIWGAGLWLYIILLIILPKARTTAEKLEMKGQPVTAKSIKETIEEEVFDIKARLSGEKPKNNRSAVSNFFDALGAILVAGIKFIVGFFGAIITLVLGALLLALFFLLLAMAGWLPGADVPVFLTKYFLDPVHLNAGIISVGIVVGVPLLLLLNKLIQRLFKTPKLPKPVRLTAISIWIFGAVMAFFTTLSITREFRHSATQKNIIPIQQPTGDTLNLEVLPMEGDVSGGIVISSSPDFEITEKGDSMIFYDVKVDIQRAAGREFELVRICSAKGNTGKIAQSRISSIRVPINQTDSRLRLPEGFFLPSGSLYRGQEVRFVLKVPDGKSVFISEGSQAIIHDIKNVTNTLDEDMAGRTWTMTPAGLECIGCGLPTLTENDHDEEEVRIVINEKVITDSSMVDSVLDAELKDVSINVGNGRIQIETKKK